MARSDGGSRATQTILFTMGVALGVFAVVVYVMERLRGRDVLIDALPEPVERRLAHRPIQAITLSPPAERGIQAMPITLRVEALPEPFVRRQPGTIRVATLPGATCQIEARYSTNRPPASLEDERKTADEDGRCEWTWDVRTGGEYVDVTVQAWGEGYATTQAGMRIAVVD
jgi:hypothetical protein